MMAGKKVGKETFVTIYDVSHKNKFYGSNQAELKNHLARQWRNKHKDNFQEPYGQEFPRSGICGIYPTHRNRGHEILARHHRALQERRSGRQRNNSEWEPR